MLYRCEYNFFIILKFRRCMTKSKTAIFHGLKYYFFVLPEIRSNLFMIEIRIFLKVL